MTDSESLRYAWSRFCLAVESPFMTGQDPKDELIELAGRVPADRLLTYAWLWQFETSLRRMVYIELRACYGNCWISHLKRYNEHPFKQDKHLKHMPTREELPTSFMQLSSLLETIRCDWKLFQPYLPPSELWEAKMRELTQIRHRIAHFRYGHKDDLNRVKLILRDVDRGFWNLCSSYNSFVTMMPPSSDEVIKKFLHLDPFPWSETKPRTWSRIGSAPLGLTVSVRIEISARPWIGSRCPKNVSGEKGYFYDVLLTARDNRCFDHRRILQHTETVHSKICHIFLDEYPSSVRVTIPTIIGHQEAIDIIEHLLSNAHLALRPCPPPSESGDPTDRYEFIQLIARDWPEYVIGTNDALAIIYPDTPCSFFGASI